MKKLKEIFIFITCFIAFITLIGEIEEITIKIIIIKCCCLGYIWFIAKINNYFYQEEE